MCGSARCEDKVSGLRMSQDGGTSSSLHVQALLAKVMMWIVDKHCSFSVCRR